MTSRRESFLRRYAWPMGIVGIIACFFIADGTLIFAAVGDGSVAPEEDYYEKALRHDDHMARVRRAQAQGLQAHVVVGEAPIPTMPRPVDVRVVDGGGFPITDLTGTVTAIRPADARLRNAGSLVSVPGEDGLYRLLLKIPVSGLWEFELAARRGSDEYVMTVRQDVSI